MTRWILAAGIAIGAVYVVSPLTVVCACAFAVLIARAGRGLDADERRHVTVLLVVAIGLRVAAIAGLFAVTNHAQVPFGRFFGDEELFIKRSMWVRNIALGVPISAADFIYAYDDIGTTSYLYLLAMAHALFGPSPYGVRLLSVVLYVTGCVLLFRITRPGFGAPAAWLGLALLLFLPSLFTWSISTLKEPFFFATMSLGVAVSVGVARTTSWLKRLVGAAVLAAIVVVAQSVREGGFAIAAVGTGGGVALALLIVRPRLALAALVAAAVVVPVVVTRGTVEDKLVTGLREAAKTNWGHVNTRGYVYHTLAPRLYGDRNNSDSMTGREAVEYIARSFVSYVAVPTPWQIQSRAAAAFLPEQAVWYSLVLLAPIGLMAGLRRDPVVTAVLVACIAIAVTVVALTNANIGTLVRHRGLALPYVVWFSTLGATTLVSRLARRSLPPSFAPEPEGH